MQAMEGDHTMVIRRIPFSEMRTLEAGTTVAAVESPSILKQTGLHTGIRFGIATHHAHFIYQVCRSTDMHTPCFCITEAALTNFCPTGWTLYSIEYTDDKGITPSAIHTRAERAKGDLYHELRSYPGDDFVYECIFGLNMSERCAADESIGQHWWTPLYYTVSELLELASEALPVPLPKNLPEGFNPELLHFIHHGIAIESDWVVHFATSRVPDRKNRIKLDTIATFCDITPQTEPGGPLPYKRDTPVSRALARNRAVWIYFHEKEWGRYNLLWNNCEHMSRMCKVGRKESMQVKKAIGKIALAGGGAVLPQSWIIKVASLGLPFLLNGILKNRVMQNHAPLPFESEQN